MAITADPREDVDVSAGAVKSGDSSTDWFDLAILGCLVATVAVYYLVFGFEMFTRRVAVDENLTGWVISGTFAESITRSTTHQGQSPVYFMGLWLWQSVFGSSILVLRLPSVIAHFAAAWQLRALGESLASRRAGAIAAVIFLGVNVDANDARPYTFLLLGIIVAVRLALAWSAKPSIALGIGWAAAAAFVLYMHPFGIYALMPQAIFLVIGRQNGARVRDLAVVITAAVVCVLPMVPQVLELAGRQETLVIVPLPTIWTYIAQVLPMAIFAGVIVAFCVNGGLPTVPKNAHRTLLFVSAWAFVPATALFIHSHLTGDSLFVGRYLNGAMPGLALLVGVLLTMMHNARAAIAGLVVFVVATAFALSPLESPDWNPATRIIADSPDALIVTMSGYIELANADAFPPSDDTNEYFNGPLRFHGVTAPLQSIPRDASDQDLETIRSVLRPAIENQRPVVLVDFVWIDREDGPAYAEALLLSDGYRVDVADVATGVRTTRFVRDQ